MSENPTDLCAKCGQPLGSMYHDPNRWPGRLLTTHPYHAFVARENLTLDDLTSYRPVPHGADAGAGEAPQHPTWGVGSVEICPRCGQEVRRNKVIRHGDMLVYLDGEAISVNAYYREHGFADLPPTPTLPGYEIKARAASPFNPGYGLAFWPSSGPPREIGDSESVPVSDGMRFIRVPPAGYRA